jgi:hypothetical protein
MLFTYHNSDYKAFSNEDDVRAVINKGSATAGQYVLPYSSGMKALQEPAMVQKMKEGPVGFVLLRAPGPPTMGPALGQWFVLTLVISYLVAYVTGLVAAPGTAHLAVFRIAGTIAFLAYAVSQVQEAIWRAVPWSSAAKTIMDGVVYALVTGAIFAWTWPAM